MEMANYILSILKSNLNVVWSWGFNGPQPITDGLIFRVQGFKYDGWVKVVYDGGMDLFDVELVKSGKIIEGIYFDQLVEIIDNEVEKTIDYKERITKEYGLEDIH